MSPLRRVRRFVRNVVLRRRVEQDLDAELRAYVQLLAEEKARAGLSPEAAWRAARLEAGGVEQVKEEVRDVRAGAWTETLARDVRYGVRTLARRPGYTVAAALALALGIGAATAMLSVVDAVLLRPLPYADADRLAVVLHEGRAPVAPANFRDWRDATRSFAAMEAAEVWGPVVQGEAGPEALTGLRLTPGMLDLLGVRPALGRLLDAGPDGAARREVVIGHALWQRRFGGQPSVVGRTLRLDDGPYTIVGVMPRDFAFAPFWVTDAELWAPLDLAARADNRRASSLRVFARLAPGVTLAQANAEVAAVTGRLEAQFPGTNRDVQVRPLAELVVGDVRPALLVLLAAVGFLLLTACANVAHMLLARAAARQQELALRTALGATRGRMVRQLLTESVLLAGLGGALGVALAWAAVQALVAAAPAFLPRAETVQLDGRVLLVSLVLTLGTGLAFGLLPALRASRTSAMDVFRDGAWGSSVGRGQHRVRDLLVASEIALALVLLVGAGLMSRSFVALRAIDPGFRADGVLAMTVSVTGTASADPGRRAAFYQEVVERAAALPGVVAASAVNHLPLAGDQWGQTFAIEGRPTPPAGDEPRAVYRVVLPGYFAAMGVPLVEGRDVGALDRLDAAPVVVVNRRLAERYWPGTSALGQRLALDDSTWATVVGVTENLVQQDWTAAAEPELFVPYLQNRNYLTRPERHFAYLTLVVRTACGGRAACDGARQAAALRGVVRAAEPGAVVSSVLPLRQVVREATSGSRLYLWLVGAFAAVALALAAIGVYGVMSYTVAGRAREIAIRLALGARPWGVIGLVARAGLRVALVGAAVGVIGALALTHLLDRLLYGVTATDPATFAIVTLVLCGVALLASVVPAWRATRRAEGARV